MRACVLIVLMFASGCVLPFMIPPMKAEIGGGTRTASTATTNAASGDEMEPVHATSSLHAAVGAHLASGTLSGRQPFDVGAGWTFETTRDQTSHGLYLDMAHFIERSGRWRTSVGGRGELRWLADGEKGGAALLRIDTEVFSAGEKPLSGRDRCGAAAGTAYGTSAFGFFVQAGRAWAPEVSGGAGWVATAGISVRTPLAAGVYVGVPGCK
jgi:hypothetical protein